MRKVLSAGLLSLAIGALPAQAQAQTRAGDPELQRAMAEQARAVKGWPGGIVFTCVVTPADLANEAIRQICAQAAGNAGAMANQAKAKFVNAPDPTSFRQAVQRDRALGLTLQIAPSDFNAQVAVLVIRLFASRYYPDLVSSGARAQPNAAQNPLAAPRAGDAIFWEEAVVGSGPPAQLAQGIVPAIDAKLRQFFQTFSVAAPAPAPAPAAAAPRPPAHSPAPAAPPASPAPAPAAPAR